MQAPNPIFSTWDRNEVWLLFSLSVQMASAFPRPPPSTARPSSGFMLLSYQLLIFPEPETCVRPLSLHIICYCDSHQGNLFSLDLLVTLLLDHQKQPRMFSAWYRLILSVPLRGRIPIRSASSRHIPSLAFISSCPSFQRNPFPWQRKEINAIYRVYC